MLCTSNASTVFKGGMPFLALGSEGPASAFSDSRGMAVAEEPGEKNPKDVTGFLSVLEQICAWQPLTIREREFEEITRRSFQEHT